MNNVEERPWGTYRVIGEGSLFKVKEIIVNSGERLSYQSHEKRDELWQIVKGGADVIIEGKYTFLSPGDFIQILRGQKHRVENNREDPLIFVEIQTGDYFGEDDIERFQDDYNRI